MSNEINNSKPEWFQLVDSDAPSAQVKKIDKKLPAMAALVAGAIIATGSFFAGATNESQVSSLAVASSDSTSPTQSKSVTIAEVSNAAPAVVAITTPTNNVVQAPGQGGVKAPTGQGDEDEDEDDDDRGERDHDRD